jgi:hypothetical protein
MELAPFWRESATLYEQVTGAEGASRARPILSQLS